MRKAIHLPHAQEQAKTVKGAFEHLYVKKAHSGRAIIASYVVTDDSNEVVYFKSVNVVTQEVHDTGHNLHGRYALADAFDAHYSNEYVALDGLIMMQELCADYHKYPEGALPHHAVFGQGIYHADLEELYMRNGEADGSVTLER